MIGAPATSPSTLPASSRVEDRLVLSRAAQRAWAATPVRTRVQVLRRFRHALARSAEGLVDAIGRPAPHGRAESLAAEVLPLVDACRWLEREAPGVLRPTRYGRRGRPQWLRGVESELRRDPWGLVLVLAPSNYPLFLAGVQALQALAAGNAVLVKPAPGCSAPMQVMASLLDDAGLDPALFVVVEEDVGTARGLLRGGVDKVVLTGSAATGRAVLDDLAPSLTPAVMELSGCDAVFVRDDADLDLVTEALRFGLTFNRSATCIAPRRVFVSRARRDELETRLVGALGRIPAEPPPERQAALIQEVAREALIEGARVLVGHVGSDRLALPLVLTGVRPDMRIARTDVFAPVLSVLAVEDDEDALRQAAHCPYALGASVFGALPGASRLAARVPVGLVTVNDLIAPSADPRVPFGGRGESGFGTTRGREGLLEMTATKVIQVRRGRSRRHFDAFVGGEDAFFLAWLRMAHGATWRERVRGIRELMDAGRALMRAQRDVPADRGD